MAGTNVWNLKYVVGNPAMFDAVTSCADNPMKRAAATEAASAVAQHGWRVWVEHAGDPSLRIFESEAEKSHRVSRAEKEAQLEQDAQQDRSARMRGIR